jgi:hypothetical protein
MRRESLRAEVLMRAFFLVTFAFAACEAPPQPDDANDAGVLGATDAACSDDSDCASGLCNLDGNCGANDCATPGAPCEADNLFCTGGDCGRACEAPREGGEQCLSASDFPTCTDFRAACADGFVCGYTIDKATYGSCVTPTDRAAGEPCGDDVTSCADGLECGAFGVCDGAGEGEGEGEGEGIGASCNVNEECESGLCGAAEVGVCVVNECPTPGVACDAGTFCAGGSCGRNCEAARVRGDACLLFSDFADSCSLSAVCENPLTCGQRNFGKFGNGFCVPLIDRGGGEPCGDDVTSCAAGLVCAEESQSCE